MQLVTIKIHICRIFPYPWRSCYFNVKLTDKVKRIKSSLIFKISSFFNKNSINLICDFCIEALWSIDTFRTTFTIHFESVLWHLGKPYCQEGKAIKHL